VENIMKNSLLMKFKRFLDIFRSAPKKIELRIEPQLASKVVKIELQFSHNEKRDEFEEKISQLTQYELGSKEFLNFFNVLVKLDCSIEHSDIIMKLVKKIDKEEIPKAFDSIINHDNLKLCDIFLTHNEEKYKNIIIKEPDYIYYLCLSIASGAKKITEHFLKDDKFNRLLAYENVAKTALVACLLSNQIEIANLLLSHNINLSAFKDENGNPTNLEKNELYKTDVVKPILKKLLHDQLITDLENNQPIKSKKTKL
jgi:hypothetical protein